MGVEKIDGLGRSEFRAWPLNVEAILSVSPPSEFQGWQWAAFYDADLARTRSTARPTVERATPNMSASSLLE